MKIPTRLLSCFALAAFLIAGCTNASSSRVDEKAQVEDPPALSELVRAHAALEAYRDEHGLFDMQTLRAKRLAAQQHIAQQLDRQVKLLVLHAPDAEFACASRGQLVMAIAESKDTRLLGFATSTELYRFKSSATGPTQSQYGRCSKGKSADLIADAEPARRLLQKLFEQQNAKFAAEAAGEQQLRKLFGAAQKMHREHGGYSSTQDLLLTLQKADPKARLRIDQDAATAAPKPDCQQTDDTVEIWVSGDGQQMSIIRYEQKLVQYAVVAESTSATSSGAIPCREGLKQIAATFAQ